MKPSGGAAPVLPVGRKLAFADFECAVGPGPSTYCVKGSPATQWMIVSPSRTGVGPATDGLPAGFPDPNDFVLGDDTYLVGTGAKNLFPVFTVDGGLTCSIIIFSGGEIGCDGPLPGVRNGDDEVYAQLPGSVGTRRSVGAKFGTPPTRDRSGGCPSATGCRALIRRAWPSPAEWPATALWQGGSRGLRSPRRGSRRSAGSPDYLLLGVGRLGWAA